MISGMACGASSRHSCRASRPSSSPGTSSCSCATTLRDFRDAAEPPQFPYGFWYAFHICVIAISVGFCTLTWTYPLALLFFCMKYFVDRHNLDDKVFVQGPENGGIFTFQVVKYLKLTVSVWWMVLSLVIISYAQMV